MTQYRIILCSLLLLISSSCSSDSTTSYIFELIIRNTASPTTFTTAGGQQAVIAFSTALGVVHTEANPLLTIGAPASEALEKLAEDGDFSELITSLRTVEQVSLTLAGVDPVEEGAEGGILLPGNSYRIVFNVEDINSRLSLALGFLQANDIVVANGNNGIALFDGNGQAIAQDITSSLLLLDAGTEQNQAPGEGDSQTIRQMEPNTGADEGGVVRPVDDGFSYPAVSNMLQVSINPVGIVE